MGLFAKKYASPHMDGLDADTLLARAKGAEDPRDAHAYLLRAEQLSPDDLRVQRELLLRGELHTRDPKAMNFFVIKCYLLHALEHPEQHDEAEQKRMLRELFEHPRLIRCQSLAPDPAAFTREYLQDLCAEYVRLFIAGDTRHTRSVAGITLGGKLPKYLAEPAYDVLYNAFSSPFLSQEEQLLLGGAFYRAYSAYMGGKTEPLDARLGNLLGRLIQ